MSDDDVGGLDEEFLYHLNRGADLLAKGEPEPARAALARARDLRPRDPKSLGLLGQSLYKLGRFDEAIEVYGRLVDESPIEATARVNLGLANLKAKRYAQAVRQLEIALDLNPEHKKAMGYLGLAWLEQGDLAQAREWFERAGSEAMVSKCDDLLAPGKAGEAGSSAPPPEQPSLAAEPVAAAAASRSPGAGSGGVQALGAFAASRLLELQGEGTFALARGLLTVAIRGEVLVREEGLLAVRGAVRLVPEMKRFRGRATDKPFGEGARRMLRASGLGALLYRARGSCLVPVDLEGESAYFLDDVVFAFEDPVAFENGRVASRIGQDLNLVHLRGPGRVLLATRGEIAALEVTRETSLRVPFTALVGWTGALVPRVVPMAEAAGAAEDGSPGGPLMVELGGDGRVLLDQGAAS